MNQAELMNMLAEMGLAKAPNTTINLEALKTLLPHMVPTTINFMADRLRSLAEKAQLGLQYYGGAANPETIPAKVYEYVEVQALATYFTTTALAMKESLGIYDWPAVDALLEPELANIRKAGEKATTYGKEFNERNLKLIEQAEERRAKAEIEAAGGAVN